MVACAWFVVQAIIYFVSEGTQKPTTILKVFQFIATGFCGMVDNFPAIFGCFKKVDRRAAWISTISSVVIGVLYFLFLVSYFASQRKKERGRK
jgi:hypothetical protein